MNFHDGDCSDSMIALPPKPAILFNECFMAARLAEGCYEKYTMSFLIRKGKTASTVER